MLPCLRFSSLFSLPQPISVSWARIGLQNYIDMFSTGEFWLLIRNNLIFLISIPGILLISLSVSVLLFEEVPGWRFFRSVYYLPTILSAVVVGFLMQILFTAQGAVNEILASVGLDMLTRNWLGSAPTA